MDFNNLKSINQGNTDQADKVVDKAVQELATLRTQEVFVKSIQALANIIQNHTTQTVVLNQLKDYATSKDISGVESGVKSLLEELKTHENTDVTPIVAVLKEAVSELKSIPKDKVEIEIPEAIDYTERFNDLVEETKNVLKAIQEQETTVEAPVVNVEAPTVNVDAPDLKPLTKEITTEFSKAIKSIVIPKFDVSSVVTEQQNTTEAIKGVRKVLENMPLGGSSGSSSIAPFLVDGALPITGTVTTGGSSTYQSFNDTTTDTNLVYLGKASPGSATTDAAWQIKRYNKSAGTMTFADDVTTFTKQWSARTGYTY